MNVVMKYLVFYDYLMSTVLFTYLLKAIALFSSNIRAETTPGMSGMTRGAMASRVSVKYKIP